MAFTFIASASGVADASGTTVDCSASLNVAAGDLLVGFLCNEGADVSFAIAATTGAANSFTFDAADKKGLVNDVWGNTGYKIAAVANATATFRGTYGSAVINKTILVMQFRPDAGATVTKDGSNGLFDQSGTAASHSNNITTTGTDEVAVGASDLFNTAVTSAEQINAVNATGVLRQTRASIWYRILTATFTGQSTATQGIADHWVCHIIAFKSVASAGLPTGQASFDSITPVSASHRVRRWPIELRTSLESYALVLIGKDALPFRRADWPNATLKPDDINRRTWTDSYNLMLIGNDRFFGADGMGPDYDYPNPTLKPDAHSRRTWLNWYTLPLIGADALPFALGDWPVPKGPAPLTNLRTWLGTLKLLLIGKDALPFNLEDWPIPFRYRPKHQDQQKMYDLPLVGQDALPFALSQWPNPTLARDDINRRTHWWSPLVTLLVVIVQAPFALLDWPNPFRYRPAHQDQQDSYNLSLIGADFLPFAQGDWPVPKGAPPLTNLRTWLVALVQQLGGADVLPFALSDWPNPLRATPVIDLRTWLQSAVNTTLQVVGVPFFLGDWPNPLRARPKHQDQQGWYTLGLVGQDFLPFAQGDWPVPKGQAPLTNLRTWIGALQQQLVGADLLPFRLLDWLNPWGARPKHRDHQGTYTLSLIGQDQFYSAPGQGPANLDWPVPKGYHFSSGLRSWLLNILQSTLAPAPPPPPTAPVIIYLKESGRLAVRLTQNGRIYEEI